MACPPRPPRAPLSMSSFSVAFASSSLSSYRMRRVGTSRAVSGWQRSFLRRKCAASASGYVFLPVSLKNWIFPGMDRLRLSPPRGLRCGECTRFSDGGAQSGPETALTPLKEPNRRIPGLRPASRPSGVGFGIGAGYRPQERRVHCGSGYTPSPQVPVKGAGGGDRRMKAVRGLARKARAWRQLPHARASAEKAVGEAASASAGSRHNTVCPPHWRGAGSEEEDVILRGRRSNAHRHEGSHWPADGNNPLDRSDRKRNRAGKVSGLGRSGEDRDNRGHQELQGLEQREGTFRQTAGVGQRPRCSYR